ncbi:unnamed protein product [Zymoseptoria tritici ST99CH_1E4]|uniref:Tryptophan synthase beta chain-like PALP domain-containing protein n=1 Tax=Zymoseptoria tritici ST99CH_1E4 TaxID=1276532 RepID=A0A2H1H8F6_ZYMTR|nr:unnamed protein product [Zymoseptoria tritici ST99CH_1E4]
MATTTTPTYIRTLSSLPKTPLLFAPSPIQPLPRLLAHLHPPPSSTVETLSTKREDLHTFLPCGGNKIRKLQYLVADALDQGCDTLVSIGGVQSNHTRAVTAVAKDVGLEVVTVQESWVPVPEAAQPGYGRVGNILLSRLMGGDVRVLPPSTGEGEGGEDFGIGHKSTAKEVCEEVKRKGGKAYYIPAGASDHPLGGMGFVEFVVELAEQEVALQTFHDTLVVCSVTGSTQAGLVVGAVAEGRGRRIIGIDASGKPEETRAQVLRIARATAATLDPELVVREEDVVLDERFHEGTYGLPGPSTIEAMKVAARTEALITDPVYEGKSMAGLIALIKEGGLGEGAKNVLFVHLGGQSAVCAYESWLD